MMAAAEQPTAVWIPGPILGIETSCDETAASVLAADGAVLSNIITSQHAVHRRFGGVVPELASRAHIESIEGVSSEALRQSGHAWADLTGIAVTQGPGMAGALLVGVNYGKALGYILNIPVVGVSHLEGHIASAWLQNPGFPLPCVILVVSGGHTHLYFKEPSGHCRLLGSTRDDAAGEAFDKGAQMLGLEYPGGPAIDRMARQGSPTAMKSLAWRALLIWQPAIKRPSWPSWLKSPLPQFGHPARARWPLSGECPPILDYGRCSSNERLARVWT